MVAYVDEEADGGVGLRTEVPPHEPPEKAAAAKIGRPTNYMTSPVVLMPLKIVLKALALNVPLAVVRFAC